MRDKLDLIYLYNSLADGQTEVPTSHQANNNNSNNIGESIDNSADRRE